MQPDEKRIEQWLDSALREYGATEARSGLEARVFASLRTASVAERARAGHRRWWMLAGSVATAAVIVALWIGWNKSDRVAHEVSGTKAPVLYEPQERSDHDTAASLRMPDRVKVSERQRRRYRAGHPISLVTSNPLPRREEFPSRESSDQYKLLAAYVTQTPRDEVANVLAKQEPERELHIQDLAIPPLNGEASSSKSN